MMMVECPHNGYEVFSEAERGTIADIAAAAVTEVRALLPILSERIVLVVYAGEQVILETGEMGAAMAPGLVSWTVDATRPEGVVAIAREQLRPARFYFT